MMVSRRIKAIFELAYLRHVLLLVVVLTCSACALLPYDRDFDCPVGDGVPCTSLHEIAQMADRGEFGPDSQRHAEFMAKQERSRNWGKRKKKRRSKSKCDCQAKNPREYK